VQNHKRFIYSLRYFIQKQIISKLFWGHTDEKCVEYTVRKGQGNSVNKQLWFGFKQTLHEYLRKISVCWGWTQITMIYLRNLMSISNSVQKRGENVETRNVSWGILYYKNRAVINSHLIDQLLPQDKSIPKAEMAVKR
jgi:hypothetical protein